MNIDHDACNGAASADLVRGVSDDQLDDPDALHQATRSGDLLDHIGGLALAFTEAAEKSGDPEAGPPAEGDRREPGTELARPASPTSWAPWPRPGRSRRPGTGMTRAGGIDMPGEIAGMVALEEVLVHGWDLARATGQPFTAADEHLEIVVGFFASVATEESPGRRVRPSSTGRRRRAAGRSGHGGVGSRPRLVALIARANARQVRVCSEGILFSLDKGVGSGPRLLFATGTVSVTRR